MFLLTVGLIVSKGIKWGVGGYRHKADTCENNLMLKGLGAVMQPILPPELINW
jgi:hypothetical protein